MSKANILLCCSELFYPTVSGGRLAIYEKVKLLSEFYNVYLITLDVAGDTDHEVFLDEAKKYAKEVRIIDKETLHFTKLRRAWFNLKTLFLPKPRFYYFVNKMEFDLNDYMNERAISKVIIEILPASIFLKFLNNNEYVYFSHNAEAFLAHSIQKIEQSPLKKAYRFLDYIKIRSYERKIINNASTSVFFTETDIERIGLPKDRSYQIFPPLVAPKEIVQTEYGKKQCLIATNMNHLPNQQSMKWFFEEVYPHISKDITIYTTGIDFNNTLNKYAKELENVQFMGFMNSKDFDELYRRISLVINPTISGSGIQMKLLEALSYGKHAVTTDFSNFLKGDIPSSDNPEIFAKLINSFFLSKERQKPFDYKKFYDEKRNILFELMENKR